MTVVESSIGRIAVLVCEDLARLMDLGPMIRDAGVSHVFTPVLSKETLPHYWEHVKAKEYAREVGAVVVVANSLVIARNMGESGSISCSLLHSPEYTRFGHAQSPEDVSLLATTPESEHADY